MGRYYQERDYPHFDYTLETTEELSGWELRGPIPDLDKPYFVCIGATQVFGRFCARPFPKLLSEALDLPVLNLGLGGHGPRTFLNDSLLSVINRSRFAIVQLVSARTGSNSAFENSESGRGPGTRLRDGKSMTFEEFLQEEFERSSQEDMVRLIEESRDSWVANYRKLLTSIEVPSILHWLSTSMPHRTDNFSESVWQLLGVFPQLVNEGMIRHLRRSCNAYVETVSRRGLPQPLWESSEQVDGTELRDGRLYNTYYPSPEMHEAAARDLLPAARALAAIRRPADEQDVRGALVVSYTEEVGRVVAAWCGPNVDVVTYDQIREDQDLLTYMLGSKPRVIHVRQKNLVDGYIHHRYASFLRANRPPPGNIDIVELIEFTKDSLRQERRVVRLCHFVETLDVTIEDCTSDTQGVANQISSFLQRPIQEPASSAALTPIRRTEILNFRLLVDTIERMSNDLKDAGA